MKAVSCPTCNDTGWTLGGMWCQNCVRGRQNYETIGVRNPAVQNPRNARSAAFDERQTLAQDLQPVGATVASGTSPDKRWTPAHVGRALKIALLLEEAAGQRVDPQPLLRWQDNGRGQGRAGRTRHARAGYT